MKREIKIAFMVVAVLSMGKIAGAVPVNPNSVVEDSIEYYLQTDKAVYNLGEEVDILYRVTNLTEYPVDIGMVWMGYFWPSFIITDSDNTDIWQYCRVMPPGGWTMFHLDPYESKERQISWDMISDNGTPFDHDDDYPVGPGLYNVTGELTLSAAYERVPVSVSIEIIPEPSVLLLLGLGGLMLRKRN